MIVYTAIYGGYDLPKPTKMHKDVVEWRLYTDDPETYAPGWTVIIEAREAAHARMRAKWRKCHPPTDTDTSLYLDGSIRLRDVGLIEAALKALRSADWAMYPHPERTQLHEEVMVSCTMPKYRGLGSRMALQASKYAVEADDRPLGLWAGGILARRHTQTVLKASAAWYTECEQWTYQDQLSLPIVLERHAIDVAPLTQGGGLWQNTHFAVERHQSDL